MRSLDFWYDFGSTYAYLTAMRIDGLAAAAGVRVRWRPFLLGPIFNAAGWPTSPFNVYPAKGRYMVRDISRLAAERGLPFMLPDPFPANGLKAARIALALDTNEDVARFSQAVFAAEFSGNGLDIADDATLLRLLTAADLSHTYLERASHQDIKDRLRRETEIAAEKEIFGAPFFLTEDGEPFWGDDRLASALAHAAS
jgi:2-hydroxychromene-2-carboxylate isomerase